MDLSQNVEVFTEKTSNKNKNDERNKTREKIIEALFSNNSEDQSLYLDQSSNRDFWQSIKTKFESAIAGYIKESSGLQDFKLSHLVRKGGRNHNYDFFAPGVISGEESGIKIEFKKGSTIFDQPEFLSLWAKNGTLVNSSFGDYPTYFYDNYIDELVQIVGEKAPSKSLYLQDIFNTNYVHFFGSAKSVYEEKRKQFLALQYRSIDSFLCFIRDSHEAIDFDQIQNRLTEQLEKYFVSWDASSMDFKVEQFHVKDVTLDRTAKFSGGKNGLNTISLKNQAGNDVNALLRWKNHACVVGPAWQISLKSSYNGD